MPYNIDDYPDHNWWRIQYRANRNDNGLKEFGYSTDRAKVKEIINLFQGSPWKFIVTSKACNHIALIANRFRENDSDGGWEEVPGGAGITINGKSSTLTCPTISDAL